VNLLTRPLALGACAVAAWFALACADATSPIDEPAFAVDRTIPATGIGLTRCEPLPYASTSARIGPSGGTLKAGRNQLRIPAGALSRSVLIMMESPSDTLNYVVFGPEGLTFDPAHLPTLVMSYRGCMVAGPQAPLEIVYVDDSFTTVLENTEPIPADTLAKTVGSRLRHFSKYVLRTSRYAVAY
jgi:hypothetical protein